MLRFQTKFRNAWNIDEETKINIMNYSVKEKGSTKSVYHKNDKKKLSTIEATIPNQIQECIRQMMRKQR